MKVRVLIGQAADASTKRGYLPSGEVVDISNEWAAELLSRGEAELAEAPQKPAQRAEKRPSGQKRETR